MSRRNGPFDHGKERNITMGDIMRKMNALEREYNVVVSFTEFLAAMEGGSTLVLRVQAVPPSLAEMESSPVASIVKRWPSRTQTIFGLKYWVLHLLEDELVRQEGPLPF